MSPVQIDPSPPRIDLAVAIWPLHFFHEGAQTLNAARNAGTHGGRALN
jgi:hypothetical protein